jgi:hypothetical protein
METKKRRSEELSATEMKQLKKWVRSFKRKKDAYAALGVVQNTLDRILLAGSGHPDSVQKIKEVIKSQEKAA